MDLERLIFGGRRGVSQREISRSQDVGQLRAGVSQDNEFTAVRRVLRVSVDRDCLSGRRENLSNGAKRGRIRRKRAALLERIGMRIAEVVGHFPFLRGAAVGRIEAAANSSGSPNGVAAPDIGTVAGRNKNGRAPGTVGPKVVGVRAGIIVKLNISAESGLDGRGLAGVPIVVDTDEGVA